MADIHEPTVERFRRDVTEYECQPAWLDAWAVMRMFDELRAELARTESVVQAARELVKSYYALDDYIVEQTDERIDRWILALAAEVRELDGEKS